MTVTSPLRERNRNALRNDFRYAPVPFPSKTTLRPSNNYTSPWTDGTK